MRNKFLKPLISSFILFFINNEVYSTAGKPVDFKGDLDLFKIKEGEDDSFLTLAYYASIPNWVLTKDDISEIKEFVPCFIYNYAPDTAHLNKSILSNI